MRRKRNAAGKWWLGVLVVGVVLIVAGLGVGFLIKKEVARAEILEKYPDRGLPRIDIELNGVSLEEINEGSKEVKYEGNGLVLYDGNEVSECGGVTVKGRGNGTWLQEKKPYQIKFDDKVDLLGMGRARKWYLLANTLDKTNLRNAVAFEIAEMLGMEYVLGGKFAELYVDGEYRGLYYVTHAVEIDKQVVDLKNPLGVLVELDNFYGWMEEHYKTMNGDTLVVKDLTDDDNEGVAMENFLKTFNELEEAVDKKDYGKVSELIDAESFAQYYLLSEFTVNPDAYWTSFYFYKDGAEDKIHAGPGWDFDMALGNRAWGNWLGERFYSPTEKMVRKQEFMTKEFYEAEGIEGGYETSLAISRLIFNLMEIPEFEKEVERVFQKKMSGRLYELEIEVNYKMREIEKAAKADSAKWNGEGDESEVELLIEWVRKRYEYFEDTYGGMEKVKTTRML